MIASGHVPSSKTRRILDAAKNKVGELERKYWKTWTKEKIASFVTGKSGILRSVLRTITGYETTKSVAKNIFKRLLPWYDDGESALEYMEDYYGTLYGKVTGKCPIYI